MRVISFTAVRLASLLKWSENTSIFVIFCFFIFVKERTQHKLLKSCVTCFTQRWATFRSAKWSWWWPNQSHKRIESSSNCARDWRYVKNTKINNWPSHITSWLAKKLDIWIPHKLKGIHLTKSINACDLHLKHNEFDPFLKRIITGDGKWIVWNNVVRKRSWPKRDEPPQTTSNAELHQNRSINFNHTMMCWKNVLKNLFLLKFLFHKISF